MFFLVLCTGVQEHQASTKKADGVIISALEVLLGLTASFLQAFSNANQNDGRGRKLDGKFAISSMHRERLLVEE